MKNLLLLCILIMLVWITADGQDETTSTPIDEMDVKEKTYQLLTLLECWNCMPAVKETVDSRLQHIKIISADTAFCAFDKEQIGVASEVFIVLYSADNFDDFLEIARNVRDNFNHDLFLFALYSAVFHRQDTQYVQMPRIEEVAPHWFFEVETIQEAVQVAKDEPKEDHVIVIRKTSEASKLENRLSYFREDVNLSSHHWGWHIIFPFSWNSSATGIVKDRKGEFFYYMHSQIVSRYNAERMSNGMSRVQPISNFHEPLEGYASHLTNVTIGINLAARPAGLVIQDVPETNTVENMTALYDRILDAINRRVVRADNDSDVFLDNERGIDILGSIVEASLDSVNSEFYGNLHNNGHRMIALITDPDGSKKEQPGVMGFPQTAARDPVFYAYHEFIDSIFRKHLNLLPPYSKDELSLPDVNILRVDVIADEDEKNVLKTYSQEDYADFSHSRFLNAKRHVWVKYQRLDYKPFTYHFDVQNYADIPKDVTIRIFLAPKFDESGNLLEVNELRKLMIELDKFHQKLKPGHNLFHRHSLDSSVTQSDRAPPFSALEKGEFTPTASFCNCGWPPHLLIPKGTSQGMDFELFVMFSDHHKDSLNVKLDDSLSCTDALSYCGAKDQMYPDRRPMGFPFDRVIPHRTLFQFLTTNMAATHIKIKFLG